MSYNFDERLGALNKELRFKKSRLTERALELQEYEKNRQLYINRSKALQYIILLSDDNTKRLREYLESIINGALELVFGKNTYRFSLVSDLKRQHVSLNLLEYKNGMWNTLDIKNQTGDGMGQIIAFLFTVVLTEITNHRMFFVSDEVLGGLHQDAVDMVKRCIREFDAHGGQFAMIEYTFEDFGRELRLKFDAESESTSIVKTIDHQLELSV